MLDWISSFFTQTSGCSKPVSPMRRQMQRNMKEREKCSDEFCTLIEKVAEAEELAKADQANAAQA
jgi:hypothetical protein